MMERFFFLLEESRNNNNNNNKRRRTHYYEDYDEKNRKKKRDKKHKITRKRTINERMSFFVKVRFIRVDVRFTVNREREKERDEFGFYR